MIDLIQEYNKRMGHIANKITVSLNNGYDRWSNQQYLIYDEKTRLLHRVVLADMKESKEFNYISYNVNTNDTDILLVKNLSILRDVNGNKIDPSSCFSSINLEDGTKYNTFVIAQHSSFRIEHILDRLEALAGKERLTPELRQHIIDMVHNKETELIPGGDKTFSEINYIGDDIKLIVDTKYCRTFDNLAELYNKTTVEFGRIMNCFYTRLLRYIIRKSPYHDFD